MAYTPTELRELAGRGMTITERLDQSGTSSPPSGSSSVEFKEDKIPEQTKQRIVVQADDDCTSWDECKRWIQDRRWPSRRTLPRWVIRLNALCDYVSEHSTPDTEADQHSDRPFASISNVICEYVLTQISLSDQALFAEAARADLAGIVKDRLERILAKPLFIEFKTRLRQRTGDHFGGRSSDNTCYTEFVTNLLDGEIVTLFYKHPVLGRLVATAAEKTITEITQFITRLNEDEGELDAKFGVPPDSVVKHIEAIDDPPLTRGSRYKIRFEDRTTAIYSTLCTNAQSLIPKAVELIHEDLSRTDLKASLHIYREEYYWELIPGNYSLSTSPSRSVFYRLGALNCICYALRVSDLHERNVSFSESYPILVDVVDTARPTIEATPADGPISDGFTGTVFRSGFLPIKKPRTTDDPPTTLTGHVNDLDPWTMRRFNHVNTDRMKLQYQNPSPGNLNRPRSHPTVAQKLVENRHHVVSGFQETYNTIFQNQDTLVERLRDHLRDTRVRYKFRERRTYERILENVTVPSLLRSGCLFGLAIDEQLSPPVSDNANDGITAAERHALSTYHVPAFEVKGNERTVDSIRKEFPEFLDQSPSEQLEEHLIAFSEQDKRAQQTRINWSLGAYSNAETVVRNVNDHRMYISSSDRGISYQLIVSDRREPTLTEYCKEVIEEGMTVVEVGANIGYFTLIEASKVGASGEVYAFEPSGENVELLERNCRENGLENVRIEQLAVSDTDGIRSMIDTPQTNLNTMHGFEDDPGSGAFWESIDSRNSDIVSVPTVPLDQYVTEKNIDEIDLIRMDIQGHETRAVEGMKQTLSHIDPPCCLIIECHNSYFEDLEGTVVPMIRTILRSNFTPVGLINKYDQWETPESVDQFADLIKKYRTDNIHVVFKKED